jgi:hypothetical protein
MGTHSYMNVHQEFHADNDSDLGENICDTKINNDNNSENDLVSSKQSSIYKQCGVLVSNEKVVTE